ncbi:LysR family transcriptional regulator [Xylophilus rhododendri]|uniref:LysR family transcriptional regulator n=1 Tax=Xylophilus rhododendri TaxID=2697032 RepID=A0A857J2U2_9BURK|nr:LysR substrate-binding domain-containing protein [Xylophilus rhododendri]QHI97449.1 LysR family transcriptional regulator [Xylophilus rhododendri]
MDLKQLRYFVAVAEELNFSRAADRLHISQPPLSQQIKVLEEEMGVQLLARNSRGVRLTDAGAVFLRESRLLLEQFGAAIQATRHASRSNAGTIRLGVATSGLFSVIPGLMAQMRADFPHVELRVRDMQSDEQVLAVAQGALDLGIVHVKPERMNVGRQALYSEPFALVLPADHAGASGPMRPLAHWAEEPMVALSREHAPTVFDAVIACCSAAGFSPDIRHTARNPMTIFQMVRSGFGIALVPRSYRESAYPGVVFRELESSAGQVRLEIIWSERNASELAQKIVRELVPRLAAALQAR